MQGPRVRRKRMETKGPANGSNQEDHWLSPHMPCF